VPSSLSSPSDFQKVASFHQPIAANGLYWTAPIPDSALRLSDDGRTASVTVKKYRLTDQASFPKPGPTYAAEVDFTITWEAEGPRIPYSQPVLEFRLDFHRAKARISYVARVPSRGMIITSDPIETSDTVFAMIGTESNGSYFSSTNRSGDGSNS